MCCHILRQVDHVPLCMPRAGHWLGPPCGLVGRLPTRWYTPGQGIVNSRRVHHELGYLYVESELSMPSWTARLVLMNSWNSLKTSRFKIVPPMGRNNRISWVRAPSSCPRGVWGRLVKSQFLGLAKSAPPEPGLVKLSRG